MSFLTNPAIVNLVQILTLIVIIWYTVETMRLRRQSVRQHLSGITPYIAASVVEDKGSKGEFICSLRNLTSRVALEVHIVIYDAQNRNFRSELGYDVGEEDSEVKIKSAPKTEREIIEEIDARCRVLLGYSENSYLCVFFKDIEGGFYVIKTHFYFSVTDNQVYMQKRLFRRLT